MTNEPELDDTRSTHTEALSIHQIHRLVRAATLLDAGNRDDRVSKLAMLALCFVCLVLGASGRDIAVWAIGDAAAGPYGSSATWRIAHFRCGMTTGETRHPVRSEPEEVRVERTGPAGSDETAPLPVPAPR